MARVLRKTAAELEVGDILDGIAQVVYVYKVTPKGEIHLDVKKLSDGSVWKSKLVPGRTFRIT